MTENEFIRAILEAITGTRAPKSNLEAADAHKASVIEGMLATVELGERLDSDEYGLVEHINHNFLSTLITAQLETNQLLRVLIERLPERVEAP